jgi:hypothetical protein
LAKKEQMKAIKEVEKDPPIPIEFIILHCSFCGSTSHNADACLQKAKKKGKLKANARWQKVLDLMLKLATIIDNVFTQSYMKEIPNDVLMVHFKNRAELETFHPDEIENAFICLISCS